MESAEVSLPERRFGFIWAQSAVLGASMFAYCSRIRRLVTSFGRRRSQKDPLGTRATRPKSRRGRLTNTKRQSKHRVKNPARAPKKRRTVGARIIEGLEQAIAWTRGENNDVRVTLIQAPEVNVREVRTNMGLSQAQFATKFGLPPATLRNWEQGRSRPDAPTRVLLAVIAKHPEAVEDVLRKAS